MDETTFIDACARGKLNVVRIQLNLGVNVNCIKLPSQQTGLFEAADSGHSDVVQLLLQHNAEVDRRNQWGLTPLAIAALNGNVDIIHILHGNGAEIDAANNKKFTPLHQAASRGHVAATEALLQYGANIEAHQNKGDFTPLQQAAWNNQVAIIEVLLKHGADLHAKTKENDTALHIAAYAGRIEACRALLQLGLSPDDVKCNGNTPICEARDQNKQETVDFFLEYTGRKVEEMPQQSTELQSTQQTTTTVVVNTGGQEQNKKSAGNTFVCQVL